VLTSSECIQCRRTTDEIGHGAVLLTRPRPMHSSEYQICSECARRVREEQDERAQAAIRQAERAGA
jgi:hypothetical protein